MPLFSDADMPREAGDMQRAGVCINDLIFEGQSSALHLPDPAAYGELLTIHSGLDVARADFGHSQVEAAALKAGVIVSALTGVTRPSFFKIDDVAGVMDDAHRVCFGVTDVEAGFGDKAFCGCQSGLRSCSG